MKRILTALLTLCMVFALALPALAEDAPSSTPTTPTPAPQTSDFRVVAYTVTDVAGGEVTTVKKDDHINIVVQIADFNAGRERPDKGLHCHCGAYQLHRFHLYRHGRGGADVL